MKRLMDEMLSILKRKVNKYRCEYISKQTVAELN